jgi:hypothetical protein
MYNETVTSGIKNIEIFTKNIFLDVPEKTLFMRKELVYLVALYDIGTFDTINQPLNNTDYYFPLQLYNPTKYIFWVLQREDVYDSNMLDNYTTSFDLKYNGYYTYSNEEHILDTGVIMVNNTELTNMKNAVFLSNIQMYENFKNGTNFNFYNYCFALDPTSFEPTGSINFSKILNKDLKLSLVDPSYFTNQSFTPKILVRTYSCKFNILRIRDGLAGLVYK